MAQARAKFVRGSKAERIRKVLGTLTQEQLNDGDAIKEAVKKAGIEASTSEIYGYRKQIRNGGGSENGTIFVPNENIGTVQKAANKIGGLAKLKSTIEYIERVQSIR